MATLNFFCMVLESLTERYGDRSIDMDAINIITIKLQEIEEMYQELPKVEKPTT